MRNRIRILVCLLATPLLVFPTSGLIAQEASLGTANPEDARTVPLDQPVPISPAVRAGQFANGLRYYIRENQEPENRAELRLVVNAGSILEDDDQLGLAHFLEHMAFNGTENFMKQELIGFMESIGMRLGPGVNASTSFDETNYQLELPTDNATYMETAFQILEDWAHGLTLDPEEIDMERGVVIEEWRLGQGAGSRLRDLQFPVIFNGSRYGERLPIGTLESLEHFDREALGRFYRDWYRPNLMAVIAVGDFDASQIESLTRQHFEDLENPPNARERAEYGVPDNAETLFSIETDPEMPQTSVQVYHKMAPETDWTIGGYRQRIVEQLYNSMLNNRFGEIARQANPPFVRGSSSQGQLIRPLAAYFLSASVLENGIERGLESLFTEAERVARFGFTESELERQKTNLLRGMERAYTNRENRDSGAFAREYARAFLNGESIPGIEYEYALHQRFVPEISIDAVNRIGQDWIRDANRVVIVAGPEKEGLVMPSEAALTAVLTAVSDVEITAYVDTVIDAPLLAAIREGSEIVRTRMIEGDITEWDLANGIRIVLKPTDFDEDQILFRGSSPGGTSLASDTDYIPASTAATLISNSGVGEFNAIDLQKVLTGKLANVRPFISDYEEGVSGNASTADLETMFQLIYLRFTAPRADDNLYELWAAQTRQALANRDSNPATAFSDAYNRIITQDHPRRRPPTVAILDETDLYESLSFYEDRFSDAGDYTFVFVGNIDFDVMRPLVERYLGALPSTGRQETWRDIGVRAPTGVFAETVYGGIEPRSQTRIAFTGPFDYEDQAERTGIRAMAMVLETRLRDRMREELGGTYSINVGANMNWQPAESYTLTITFGSDPERTDELVQVVFDGIEDLKSEPPEEALVSDIRQALLRTFETGFQENRALLGQLASDYQRGVDPGASIRSYPASAEALTPASVQEDAQQYLNLENQIRVTLMPDL
jgi:zinc protease